jgi:hypothetical protein
MLKQCDGNVAVRSSRGTSSPLILWSPSPGDRCQAGFDSLEDLQHVDPLFSVHSRSFAGYDGPLFRGADLRHYEVLPEFPGSKTGVPLPADIGSILRRDRATGSFPGAFAPLE